MGLLGSEWVDKQAPSCWIKNENASDSEIYVRASCLTPFGLSVSGPCWVLCTSYEFSPVRICLNYRKLVSDFFSYLNCVSVRILENCLIQSKEQNFRTSIRVCLLQSRFLLLHLTRSSLAYLPPTPAPGVRN